MALIIAAAEGAMTAACGKGPAGAGWAGVGPAGASEMAGAAVACGAAAAGACWSWLCAACSFGATDDEPQPMPALGNTDVRARGPLSSPTHRVRCTAEG